MFIIRETLRKGEGVKTDPWDCTPEIGGPEEGEDSGNRDVTFTDRLVDIRDTFHSSHSAPRYKGQCLDCA